MNPKFYRLLMSLLLVSSIATLTGCPRKRPPTPADTVMGRSQDAAANQGGSSYDFDYSGSSQDVYSEDLPVGALPELRDQSFDDAERIQGLLPSIYFDFDQSFVKVAERFKLEEAADHLKSNANDRLLLEGYCDWRGTTEYNLGLGDRRANAVKIYLHQLGIEPERIGTLSKGDLEAIANGTEEQMAHDRRADLIILR